MTMKQERHTTDALNIQMKNVTTACDIDLPDMKQSSDMPTKGTITSRTQIAKCWIKKILWPFFLVACQDRFPVRATDAAIAVCWWRENSSETEFIEWLIGVRFLALPWALVSHDWQLAKETEGCQLRLVWERGDGIGWERSPPVSGSISITVTTPQNLLICWALFSYPWSFGVIAVLEGLFSFWWDNVSSACQSFGLYETEKRSQEAWCYRITHRWLTGLCLSETMLRRRLCF